MGHYLLSVHMASDERREPPADERCVIARHGALEAGCVPPRLRRGSTSRTAAVDATTARPDDGWALPE